MLLSRGLEFEVYAFSPQESLPHRHGKLIETFDKLTGSGLDHSCFQGLAGKLKAARGRSEALGAEVGPRSFEGVGQPLGSFEISRRDSSPDRLKLGGRFAEEGSQDLAGQIFVSHHTLEHLGTVPDIQWKALLLSCFFRTCRLPLNLQNQPSMVSSEWQDPHILP